MVKPEASLQFLQCALNNAPTQTAAGDGFCMRCSENSTAQQRKGRGRSTGRKSCSSAQDSCFLALPTGNKCVDMSYSTEQGEIQLLHEEQPQKEEKRG